MLVLTRKVGQSLLLDGGIEIMVVDIGRGQVKIGIEAPKSVNVARKEIVGKPRRES